MYIGYARLCVCLCVCVFRRIPTLLHGPGRKLGNGRGCPIWADLQSVHRFRCYDNIAPNSKCQRVLVLAPCLVDVVVSLLLLLLLLLLLASLHVAIICVCVAFILGNRKTTYIVLGHLVHL